MRWLVKMPTDDERLRARRLTPQQVGSGGAAVVCVASQWGCASLWIAQKKLELGGNGAGSLAAAEAGGVCHPALMMEA